MVSFQCHACGDVVKKPKLDQHHGRCHTGFDCIDCSVTFNTPTEYKSHISCVSEAEKYQKSLYKGPRHNNGVDENRNHANGNSNNYAYGGRGGRGGFQGRGRGGFDGRGERQGGGRPRGGGTGANGTPLGTPQRMSPVITASDDTRSESKAKDATVIAVLPMNSQSLDAAPTSSLAKNEESGPSKSGKPKKEKKRKDKKSKSEQEPCGEVKVNELGAVGDATAPSPTSSEKALDATKKKKGKKAKNEQATAAEQSNIVINEQVESDDRKKKKKSKGKPLSANDAQMDATTQAKGIDSAEDREPIGNDSQMEIEENSFSANGKEDVADTGVSERPSDNKDAKERKKKRKHKETPDEPIVPLTEPMTEPLQNEIPEKKSKKRRREGEREDGDAKRTKKSSKESRGTGVEELASPVTSSGKKCKREKADGNSAPRLEVKKEKRRKRSKE